MINTLTLSKFLLFALSAVIMLNLFLGINRQTAQAQTIEKCLSQGASLEAPDPGKPCEVDKDGEDDATTRVNNIIATVINVLSLVVGVVAVIMIIIGGFKYITSGGDSGNVTGAKNTILYAVIGLVVVALAQIIVRFVLSRATATT